MHRFIIPAAGEAVRFGGVPKELLPISETDCALTRAIKLALAMQGTAVVISNPLKEYWHRKAIQRAGLLEVEIIVRKNFQHKDLWGSIERGLRMNEAGGLILADTTLAVGPQGDGLTKLPEGDLAFGVFETREPGRFSVMLPDRIATKEADAPGNKAWGMVLWSAVVAEHLLMHDFSHYDRAFESAMRKFKHELFPISSYHDLGTFAAYREFLLATDLHRLNTDKNKPI